MFKTEIEELYRFQSKEQLISKFSNIKQDRKSIMLYDFKDVKWNLLPDDYPEIREQDLDLFDQLDPTKLMFNKIHQYEDIEHLNQCRELTDEDSYKFMEFHKACPNKDKEQGMVSLADPTVCGCYEGDKLVAVASLWNWGDYISDIGVLTHPDYRKQGYAESVCQYLINQVDRHIIWRCDTENVASNQLAKKLGFVEVGHIYNLKKRI